MRKLKLLVEDIGEWLLDCPRALLLVVVILIALIIGAQAGMIKERRKIDAEVIRIETDLKLDNQTLRIRESVCLRAFEDKAKYDFHRIRSVRAALGLDRFYNYWSFRVARGG